jgi:hypothetical protein
MPNICNYVKATYQPTRKEYLLAPARGVNSVLQTQLFTALAELNAKALKQYAGAEPVRLVPIRDLYPHFRYSDLAAHPAIVVLPYQLSFMSLFEFYRMKIPLIVPSAELLTSWHLQYRVLNERTWMSVLGQPQAASAIPRFPFPATANSTSFSVPLSDPNNEFSAEAVLEWVRLADFYQWPHVLQFDSLDQLLAMLSSSSSRLFREVSMHMGEFNAREERQARATWQRVLDKVHTHRYRPHRRHSQASTSASPSVFTSSSSSTGGSSSSSSTGGSSSSSSSLRAILPANSGNSCDRLPAKQLQRSLPPDINDALLELYGYRLSTTNCNAQV